MNQLRRYRRFGVFLGVLALAGVSAWASPGLEVISVTPAFSPYNVAGRTATLKGVGFTASTTVEFGTVSAAVTFIDSRTLVVTIPTVPAAAVSTVTVSDPADGTDTFYPFMHTGPVIYVAPTGNDQSMGTDPNSPKLTIGSAFSAASATTPTEVRVAAGHYVEPELALPDRTVLSCGWQAGFGLRDPDGNVTEVDANGGGWVIRTAGLQNVSMVDGCTISHGLRDGFGGGAFVISADSLVSNDNVIVGNMSTIMGGAAYFEVSTLYGGMSTFSNNVMIGNRAHNKNGGGIMVYPNYNTQQDVRVNVEGNFILGNRSVGGRGGGFALSTSSYSGYNTGIVKMMDNVISGNSARSGGGVDLTLLTAGDFMDLNLTNNLVTGNTAQGVGGGMAIEGFGSVDGKIASSTIANNAAGPGLGGGLLLSGGTNLVSTFSASDLILWGNAGGDAAGQATSHVDYSDSGTSLTGVADISSDPLFMSGTLGSFYLAQVDANLPVSPAVDAGSAMAADLSLDVLTTRTDEQPDSGIADMGYHFPDAVGTSANPIAITRLDPVSGDLQGRDWVLIRGDGFNAGATVTFGGVAATNVLFVGNRRLLVQPAPHALGPVDVTVTDPDMTSASLANGYEYIDNTAPMWVTTVGIVSAVSAVDTCQRSVILDWNDAADVTSNPVVYEVYRVQCVVSSGTSTPCDNFGYIPNAANYIGSTIDTTWVDLGFTSGGQDQKWIYNVRARDSATPNTNKEWNYAKRVVTASKAATGMDVPAAEIGNNLFFLAGSTSHLDWPTSSGAVSYGLYRETAASAYGDPNTLTPFLTLTSANNDANGDGVTDSDYDDTSVPAAGEIYFYRVTAIDPCGNETRGEL